MIWCEVSDGYFWRTKAATPETTAAEKDVPAGETNCLSLPSTAFIRPSSRADRLSMLVPGAAIDTHGPAKLKSVSGLPSASTAPTVRT